MTILTSVLARAARLPPPRSSRVVVDRDIDVKMRDGVVLLADRWYAPETVASDPVVLIRSPYGRRPFGLLGRFFAERGYQTVVQSVRGTFGSGGQFVPFRHEREDGTATLAWLGEQPWGTGAVGMYGPSYLGLVQWAVAADPPPELRALAAQVTAANLRDSVVYPGGSFSLETGATWVHQIEFQERGLPRMLWSLATSHRRLAAAYRTLPLAEADVAALGHRVDFYQDWLVHEQFGDGWWDSVDCTRELRSVPPMTLVGGWFDIFLPEQVADYRRLREAGREVRLSIGPWTHSSPRAGAYAFRDGLDWFGRHLRGEPRGTAKPVRVYVTGARRWIELDDWPPPATVQRWHLQAGGRLAAEVPGPSEPDRYRYDPADPAPGLSGASLDPIRAGTRVQRRREERADVLVYTSDPLPRDLVVAGPLVAEVWFRSSRPHTDLFVRLCEVDPRGRSRNRSDGITRIEPAAGGPQAGEIRCVRIAMWPVAHAFRRGTRVRLQVSSAAHPLYARNTNSGEPLATAHTMIASDQEVFHDPDHPSAIELPVSTGLV